MSILKKKETKKKETAAPAAPKTETAKPTVSVAHARVVRAHVSEKAYRNQPLRQYVFWVAPHATKPEIRREIAKRYGVTVTSVNTVSSAGKPNHYRGKPGRQIASKKAVVTVKKGQSIEIA